MFSQVSKVNVDQLIFNQGCQTEKLKKKKKGASFITF